jgi:uncharacterized protein GlcG (DUF336 family)
MSRSRTIPDAEIFSAVRALLAAGGDRAVAFSAVARATGLAAPTLVQRYGSRDRMLQAALLAAWDDLDAATAKAEPEVPLTAKGALALGMGSRSLFKRAKDQPFFIAAATSAIGGSLIPVPGGVLVRSAEGTIIGVVGISGDTSDNDEACAVAGITAAGLSADPGEG